MIMVYKNARVDNRNSHPFVEPIEPPAEKKKYDNEPANCIWHEQRLKKDGTPYKPGERLAKQHRKDAI